MTDDVKNVAAQVEEEAFSPPYMAWATMENTLERMRTEGVPSRIDRSYLTSWSGSAQAQFLKAARSLELLDEYGRPTALLKQLATEPDMRPTLMGKLIENKYPEARRLGTDATQQQLEEVFRGYEGISGGTVRKCIAFYLAAARFAGLPLSPFFVQARGGGSAAGAPRRNARRPRTPRASVTDTPSHSDTEAPRADDEQRKRYVDLLLKKVEASNGEVETELLTRVEWLLGYRQGPPEGESAS